MPTDLHQGAVRSWFETQGDGPWTTVYRDHPTPDGNVAAYCALATPDRAQEALASSGGWLISITSGTPGFVQSWDEGQMRTTYLPRGSVDDGVEPLILVREYYGAAPTEVEVDQQFRLFHNLRFDEGRKCFVKMHADGNQTEAVRFDMKTIEVRTSMLRQYLSARSLDLLLFIDAKARSDREPGNDESQTYNAPDLSLELFHFEDPYSLDRKFGSRLLGTKVLRHGPVESCGIWPYEAPDDNFPEFIIGEDPDGRELKFTCDPEKLSNYFGKNPDAPHYLTPIHFRREVLQKYYNAPDLYTITDGRLTCASLWSVQLDNDHRDRVIVFLGDIGRDLPSAERDHWRSYMISPDAPISETNFRRSFLNQAVTPQAIDLAFRRAYKDASKAWADKFGWPLFREAKESDVYLLQELRLPLNDGQVEFERAIQIMAKLMCDSLNEKQIGRALSSSVENEKGISKFERLLREQGYPQTKRDIPLLRTIQELRSRAVAHLKGSEYQKMMATNLGSDRGIAAVESLLRRGVEFLTALTEWAQMPGEVLHPDE